MDGWEKIFAFLDKNLDAEHALNIDFVNEAMGPGARLAVELTAESARALVSSITAVLARAEAGGHVARELGAPGRLRS